MSHLTLSNPTPWMSPETMKLIGMSLLHFLWQGAALAAVASLAMAISRRASTRYWIGVVTLGLMVIAPVITFAALQSREADSRILSPAKIAWHAPAKKSATVTGQLSPAPAAPFELPANYMAW